MGDVLQTRGAARPRVLVVDGDAVTRRMLRVGLELDGAQVVESADALDAAARVRSEGPFDGAAIDAGVGGGTWSDVASAVGGADVVVLIDLTGDIEVPPDVRTVRKGDVAGVAGALHLPKVHDQRLTVVELLRRETRDIEADWRELCRWDPMLPPDSQPPIAGAVIAAVIEALGRPQPLGWGADPEVEKVAEVYSRAVGAIDVAIGQLICLRVVMRRRLGTRIPPEEWQETDDRLHMIVDRAIAATAACAAERLQEQAFLDPLTGLMNRRALERDVRREVGRAARYGRRFGVVVADLDGLKQINDHDGHPAGDEALRRLGRAMQESLRQGDSAYRIGGDEFVLLLADVGGHAVDAVIERVRARDCPQFTSGAATYPDDGDDLATLIEVADGRLFEERKRVRGTGLSR